MSAATARGPLTVAPRGGRRENLSAAETRGGQGDLRAAYRPSRETVGARETDGLCQLMSEPGAGAMVAEGGDHHPAGGRARHTE